MAYQVEFRASGKTVAWSDQYQSLLELAQDHGVDIDSLCEQGICGTCKVRLISGQVDMPESDALEPEDVAQNMILVCVSVPTSDVVLDA
jgi:3-phenylpropionate/trans-cinnamate dioxygenase ferredoxin reductase subunit